MLEGRAVDADRTDPACNAEVDCADPVAALRALAPRLSAAASDGAVLDRPHELRGMQLPGRTLLNVALTDAAVHAWDVATATGDRVTIPPQVAEPLLGFSRAFADGARGTAFGPAIPTDSPDPSDQLVALLGRTP